MASLIIDEKRYIEDNIFLYENRLNSKFSRFLDKSPVFVTYYHINVNESTTDDGFEDVEHIISPRSPLKFQKILDFPIYGLEPIVLSISQEDQGLDTSYEGDAVILPNTIKPLPNDLFIINHVNDSFIFRITEIGYDNIHPDNYYRISFKFEYLSDEKLNQLNNQIYENYSCILQNIGTEDKCIIREDFKLSLDKIKNMYNDMRQMYLSMFYSEKHNCLVGPYKNYKRVFDPLQSKFCNDHILFNDNNSYHTILLSEQFEDPYRRLKYEKSFYRFIEKPSIDKLDQFHFVLFNAANNWQTTFHRWSETDAYIMDIPEPLCLNMAQHLFPMSFIDAIKNDMEMKSSYANMIKKYILGKMVSLNDIDVNVSNEIIVDCKTDELFLFTPIILYIIKNTIKLFFNN